MEEVAKKVEELGLRQSELERRYKRGSKSGWFSSPGMIAIASAVFGLLGTGLGATLQGYWSTHLERQKFEASLILDALEPEDEKERATRLLFLLKSGLVDGLNQAGIEGLASDPSQLPRYTEEQARESFLNLGELTAEYGLYLKGPLSEMPPDVWREFRPKLQSSLEGVIGHRLPDGFLDEHKDLTMEELSELISVMMNQK